MKACKYLGCGYLPERSDGAKSPLNGRLVFQVRGISQDLKPIILSHVGRSLTDQQAGADGRYWGFPFYKKLEIYNQDKLLIDSSALLPQQILAKIEDASTFFAAEILEYVLFQMNMQ